MSIQGRRNKIEQKQISDTVKRKKKSKESDNKLDIVILERVRDDSQVRVLGNQKGGGTIH